MITSEIQSIFNVFNNDYIYEIPDFQRDFVWGEEEVTQLFKDFNEDTEEFTKESSLLDGYLLGNIVLINNDHQPANKIVIDGQQRLTTLSLLYKVLEETIDYRLHQNKSSFETIQKWMNVRGELNKGYGLFDDDANFKTSKIQHHKSLEFGSTYRHIIRPDSNSKNLSQTSTQIEEVYDVLKEELAKLDDQKLLKFVNYIKHKVMLIVTTAPTLSKAFQLFEILNNRGKDLEPLDLIKNMLLKNLAKDFYSDDERDKFTEMWKKFNDNLVLSPKRKVESSTFLKHYLVGTTGENIRKDKLFNYYSELNPSKEEVLSIVSEMHDVSYTYGKLERKEFEGFIKNTHLLNVLFKLLNLKQAQTILIPFYNESEQRKSEIVDLAIRLGASVIFSYTQTNYIEAEIPSLIKKYNANLKREGQDQAYHQFVSELERRISEKAKLAKEAVFSRKFENTRGNYNKKGYDLLRFIEAYGHSDNTVLLTSNRNKKVTLEHIMPRTPISNELIEGSGFEDLEEYKEYVNRIGNFALIGNDENSSLSNKQFDQKRSVYADSSIWTTQVLADRLVSSMKSGKEVQQFERINSYLFMDESSSSVYWTKELILKRSEKLAAYLEAILTNK